MDRRIAAMVRARVREWFPRLCRFHHAEVMRFRGALADAEQDALEAVDELLGSARAGRHLRTTSSARCAAAAVIFPGAAEAFRQSAALGFDPQPGLSLLRLDEGDTAGAPARGSPRGRGRVWSGARASDTCSRRKSPSRSPPATSTPPEPLFSHGSARGGLGQQRVRRRGGDGPRRAGARRAASRRRCPRAAPSVASMAGGRRSVRRRSGTYPAGAAYRAEGDEDAAASSSRARWTRSIASAPPGTARRSRRSSPNRWSAPCARSCSRTSSTRPSSWSCWATRRGEPPCWHDRTLRACFDRHGGEEVKHEGDGFFVAFADGRSALECAIATQRTLDQHRREHGFAPQVRIGVHEAEVTDARATTAARACTSRLGSRP